MGSITFTLEAASGPSLDIVTVNTTVSPSAGFSLFTVVETERSDPATCNSLELVLFDMSGSKAAELIDATLFTKRLPVVGLT